MLSSLAHYVIGYRGCGINFDNFLVVIEIILLNQWRKQIIKQKVNEEVLKVYLLTDESIRFKYRHHSQ